ncbi:MAG TPA: hypothetical protein VGJ13_06650 [Pseudonocardiaceae bacterium]|jgi:tetratricopeptide (TPR) repeat protein
MDEANHLLRAAREARASRTSPGFALSRSELAELVNAAAYRHTGRVGTLDGQYVAELERGVIRWPGQDYRRAFREVLDAVTDSELGFRYDGPIILPRKAADAAPPLLPPQLPVNESKRERLAWVLSGRCRVDPAVVTYLADVLTAQCHVEDSIGSARMLPVALAEIELVEQLTRQACGPVRAALVAVVAGYRLFAGSMADYNGDQRAALYHDARASEAAREVGDANLVAGVYGLKSHLAWGLGDATGTVALAEAGLQDAPRLSAGVTGFLAQMQARGHALQHEDAVAEGLIDSTEQLTARAHEHPEDEPWWTYPQTPERVLFQRGVAYRELNRYREARDQFDEARAALPASFHRDHGRWAASLALVCAHDGDVAAALTAGWQAVPIALDTGSVYTIADLRYMRRVLDRQRVDRAILGEFDEALREIIEPTRM